MKDQRKATEMQCDPRLVPVPGKKEKGKKTPAKRDVIGTLAKF